ncbi:MAG: energy transducer TonB [Paracoccaceae bacterium]
MNTGQVISGLGHLGLIGWLLFGGRFASEPLPFDVTDVAVISEADFQAMLAGNNTPETVTEVAMPEPPAAEAPAAPELPATPDQPPEQARPEVAETPPPEARPETPPEIVPPPQEEVAVLPPEPAPRPQERPVERVAPEPTPQPPEPEAAPDPVERQETTDTPAEVVQPREEATAPPEAVTEITPEAQAEVSAAPKVSKRPPSLPTRPAAPAAPATPAAAAAPRPGASTSAAVSDALASALGDSTGGAGAGSDPLTRGETEGLMASLQKEWLLDDYSSARDVVVVYLVNLTPEGRLSGTPKLVSVTGPEGNVRDVAVRQARNALIALSRSRAGFGLPPDKYDQWKEIEITFNPKKMGIR